MLPVDFNLGLGIAGVVLTIVFGTIGLIMTRHGRGRGDPGSTHGAKTNPRPPNEPGGQQVALDASSIGGSVISIGHLTINVYLDGLPETRDARKKALFEKGWSHQEKNEHEEAIHAFRGCLARENGPSEKAALLILIGINFALQGRLAEAEGTCREALAEAKVGSDREGEAAALNILGIVCSQKGELDKALDHYQQALAIDRELEDRRGEAAALGNLGIVYRQKEELDRALEHLQQALAIHRELEDRRGEAQTLGNLGDVYYVKREIGKAKALEYYQAALAIDREIGPRLGEAKRLGSIGNIYADEGKPELARQYYQDALEIQRESRDRLGEAQTLGNLGLVYADERNKEQALAHLERALEIFRAVEASAEAAKVERNIAALKARK